MNIADIIMALTRGENPNAAVMASAPGGASTEAAPPTVPPSLMGFAPPGGPDNVPARPTGSPQVSTPSGVPTLLTNPAPADGAPRILQSPPDLSNMYLKLMSDNRNSRNLDSGLSLIAAGFSKYPENRAALVKGAMDHSNQQNITSQDIMNLQKMDVERQALAIRQAAKVSLMKKYKLDRDTVDYLDASGKLDEVVKHKNTQNLTLVEHSDGSKQFFDPQEGKPVGDKVTPPKPKTGQFVEGPNGPELRSPETGLQMGAPVGLKPTEDDRALAEINAQRATKGEAPLTREDYIKTVKRDAPQEPNATQKARLAQINDERTKLGQPAMKMEDLIKLEHGGVNINVSPDGTTFPAPPQGQDYVRNPDGKVKVFPDGKPQLYAIAGGKTEQEMNIKAREEQDEANKKAKIKVQQTFSASNVGSAVDDALKLADKWGAAGVGSKIVRGVPIGGMPWDTLDAKLNTINANTAFQTLQQMRESSPTGGALGAVSDFENRLLSSTIADLRAHQDPESLKKGLIRVKAAMHLLAENDYRANPAKFQDDLTKRMDEMYVEVKNAESQHSGSKSKIERISP